MENNYDVIIIGGGPAGLSAAIYLARYKINTLVLDAAPGGQAKDAHLIENYPGFESISGMDLMNKMKDHTKKSGATIEMDNVAKIKKENGKFKITTISAKEHISNYVLIAAGTKRQKLGVPGEEEFQGKGVSYCATCDAPFFNDKTVVVVGGANSAVMAAIVLAEHASKVYISYRREKLRAEPVWVERAEKSPKIEIMYKTNVKEIKGENVVSQIVFEDGKTLDAQGIFIEIGGMPSSDVAQALGVKTDDKGKIVVDEMQKTNVDKVYAAGDITTGSAGFQQIATAVSEGSIASWGILKDKKEDPAYG